MAEAAEAAASPPRAGPGQVEEALRPTRGQMQVEALATAEWPLWPSSAWIPRTRQHARGTIATARWRTAAPLGSR